MQCHGTLTPPFKARLEQDGRVPLAEVNTARDLWSSETPTRVTSSGPCVPLVSRRSMTCEVSVSSIQGIDGSRSADEVLLYR
jgi:hypothetical protein